MNRRFEELDHRTTPLGDLVLRRRRLPGGDVDIYEITLDGAFLMSSLVSDSERALATRALDRTRSGELDVLVGGLGLGWTAKQVLDDPRVVRLDVVERLDAVIAWHRRGLVPLGRAVAGDARCHLVEGDVFAHLRDGRGRYDAILLDVDHSPRALLDPTHAAFYEVEGLREAARCLLPRGVFALWSADGIDPDFLARMRASFAWCDAEEVVFPNPSVGQDDLNTVYLAGVT